MRQRQLEESSLHAQVDLEKVEDLVKCEELWQDYNKAVEDAKEKEDQPTPPSLA